jgi:hypothetical protein
MHECEFTVDVALVHGVNQAVTQGAQFAVNRFILWRQRLR